MKYILISFFLLFLQAVPASSQECAFNIDPANIAFGAGEKLTYRVTYSASIIKTDIADIEIVTSLDKIGSTDCYKIYGRGRTRPFYSIFFEMDDMYTTWLEKSTLRSIRMKSELREGGYRYNQTFDFDWKNMIVHTKGYNVKHNRTTTRDMRLSPCSYEALGLFFNMRSNKETFSMLPGEIKNLELVLEDTIRVIKLRYIGCDEIRKVDGLGEFRTVKFGCQIASPTDQSFKDGTEFFVWLTDDRNRIPVHLETPIKVGRVTAVLSGWSGLQHPLESLVVRNKK